MDACEPRVYSQIGHVFDAANKSFELLDVIGWEHADDVLPLTLEQMTVARGAEEDAHWHHPVQVVEPLRDVESRLPEILTADSVDARQPDESLLDVLLGDDALLILDRLEQALRQGTSPR